ncbi:MAG: hypothetical protein GX047_07605 [Firmicutes bacterium]|nr:hypothetical protein [Bacillota bacterium]
MDSLIGLVVIIYLITAVVGAVVERMRRGPLYEDLPTIPTGEGSRQSGEAEGPMEAADANGTSGLPAPVSLPLEPVTAQLEEPGPAPLHQAGEMVWEMSSEQGIQEPEIATSSTAQSAAPAQESIAAHSRQRRFHGGWRRAVVMMEIMDKPRGINPYRPPWPR